MTEVGWYIEASDTPRCIFSAPRRLQMKPQNAGSPLNHCPAIQELRREFCAIDSPWDLKLAVELTTNGAELMMSPKASSLSTSITQNYLSLMPRKDWLHPSRPIIQLFVPYVFCPEDDLMVKQFPPFQHWFGERRPGLVIGGEFRSRAWPRPLAFAFEWHDLSKPLIISRGEPLFYVSFGTPLDSPVKLTEITKTPEIEEQQKRIGGVAAHVRNTGRLICAENEAFNGGECDA